MRLLVVSDTHGDSQGLVAVLRVLGRSVGALIHLGDGSNDLKAAARTGVPMPPVFGVRGNMDSEATQPLARILDAGGLSVLTVHGHRFPLGEGTAALAHAARDAGAQAVFFGHTHVPLVDEREGVLVLNPGSLSRPRGPWGPSFAVVEAREGPARFTAKFYELLRGKDGPRFRAINV